MNSLIIASLLLACLALLTQQGARQAERRHPPAGLFAEVAGLRMHYTDKGSGPAVVLIHGASTSLLDFEASISKPLSNGHRVIAVDRPGHGYSERPSGAWPDPAEQARMVHGLVRKLGVTRPLIVGHSWGGSVALAYLLNHPQDSAGGVLLAGVTHPWEGGVAWYNDLAGVPVLGDLFARLLVYPFGRLSMDAAVGHVLAPNPVPEDYVKRTGVRLSLRPQVFLANAEDLRLLSRYLEGQSRRYAEIRPPVLAVTAEKDTIVPAWNHADRLARQLPRLERVELGGAGHALHHAHPTRIAEMISSFSHQLALADTSRSPTRNGELDPDLSRSISAAP